MQLSITLDLNAMFNPGAETTHMLALKCITARSEEFVRQMVPVRAIRAIKVQIALFNPTFLSSAKFYS